MGYRALLKQYMEQLRSLYGDDFVEMLAQSGEMSKRDIGELRAIAAELQREAISKRSDKIG